jgi:hypothetical protein
MTVTKPGVQLRDDLLRGPLTLPRDAAIFLSSDPKTRQTADDPPLFFPGGVLVAGGVLVLTSPPSRSGFPLERPRYA